MRGESPEPARPRRREHSRRVRQAVVAADSPDITWLGVEDGCRIVAAGDADAAGGAGTVTLVLGTAHGPRILERLGSCAC